MAKAIKINDSVITPATSAEYDAKEWSRKRWVDYPSLREQLDMQYHDELNGTTTWKDAIAAIKTKWPKDNSGPVE